MYSLSFSDFEEYSGAIQNIDWRCTLTSLSQSYWSLNSCDIGSIKIQSGYEGSPLIFEGATHQGYWTFYLQRSGVLGAVNGIQLDSESVFLIPPVGQVCFASLGEFNWQSIHIPTEQLFPSGSAPKKFHESARVISPGYGLASRLKILVDRFMWASEAEPSVMTEPASIANFSEHIVDTAQKILGYESAPTKPERLMVSRRQLIQVAVQLIEECPEKSLSVTVLAKSVGVSERTLRTAFVEYLGMPPLRYLRLRRLNHARKLLQQAAPEELTVSGVAAQLGFWDYGRFAGSYRILFGELPSKTLQSPSAKR
ncbi:MAG: helix-turn-helix domain-containing protein [Oleispira sp.]|nr:helix-turn-helix domain-containing protein [Oleispira sp.]MBL4880017.1 helix-turn-helix domain-containing protein [Oleispira sp.]